MIYTHKRKKELTLLLSCREYQIPTVKIETKKFHWLFGVRMPNAVRVARL